jgi:hypothetical protein
MCRRACGRALVEHVDLIADFQLIEVLHLVAHHRGGYCALRAAQRERARARVDSDDLRLKMNRLRRAGDFLRLSGE